MGRADNLGLATARLRMLVCALVGLVVGVVTGLWVGVVPAVLLGWDAAAALYVGWSILGTRDIDAADTARRALSEDPGRTGLDVLLLAASVASLVGVGLVVIAAGGRTAQNMSAALAVVTVVAGWSLVHTVYTERYARLYYSDTPGGIDFNEPDAPCYRDFAYFAFTIGMTFQVSDTSITAKPIRNTVLRHALLSYLFGAVIIAAAINLLVGLAH
jgi:uncharacterized membrane protein